MRVGDEVVSSIGAGLLVLAAAGRGDGPASAERLAGRIARLRVFGDAGGKMNLSLLDTGGEALVVSQFTLYGDTSRGLRPSFAQALEPGGAEKLMDVLAAGLRGLGVPVQEGRFGAHMEVSLVNDGPVTLMLES